RPSRERLNRRVTGGLVVRVVGAPTLELAAAREAGVELDRLRPSAATPARGPCRRTRRRHPAQHPPAVAATRLTVARGRIALDRPAGSRRQAGSGGEQLVQLLVGLADPGLDADGEEGGPGLERL